ncbi:hypothetical protein KBC04_00760 [Candidatus Babeliales bacterium]|nr:hypothetical protein [Candidatus Babeliales bacterium]MBP9843378.1 hypothetical protein [Candidatus Babeliales bacterium]
MNSIKISFFLFFFITLPCSGINNSTQITTIFTPTPLLQPYFKYQHNNNILAYLKKLTIPVTGCFYYAIHSGNIITDIKTHPYKTTLILYALIYCGAYAVMENEKEKIDEEIINMIQHVFHILIISNGIYNKIVHYHLYKNITTMQASAFETLQFFLSNAYNTWLILFSYYQEHYKNKPIYAYQMDQIDLFEVLQACNQEQDILSLITNFYDDSMIYNFEPILDCLELKLKLINHRLLKSLPLKYHTLLEK